MRMLYTESLILIWSPVRVFEKRGIAFYVVKYEGLDKRLRRRAPVLKVHGVNPAMTW